MVQPHLHQALDKDLADSVLFLLHEPSHPGNIGAAARALGVMGFARLACAAARLPDWKSHPDALARAGHASDVLAGAVHYAGLEEALADSHVVIAVSADVRDFGPDMVSVTHAAHLAVARLSARRDLRLVFLFGSERHGLSRQQAAHTHLLACIPGEPAYHSLNLAQAVLLVAWELRRAMLACRPPDAWEPGPGEIQSAASAMEVIRVPSPPEGEPADAQSVEAMIRHLESAALLVGFLDPEHPKMLIPRLRRMLMRCELRREEVDLLRGFFRAIEHPRRRNQDHGSRD